MSEEYQYNPDEDESEETKEPSESEEKKKMLGKTRQSGEKAMKGRYYLQDGKLQKRNLLTDDENVFMTLIPKLLVFISDNGHTYGSLAVRNLGMNNAYVFRCIKLLKKMKVVKGEKRGRIEIIGLTDKGKRLARAFRKIFNILKEK